MFGKLEKNVSKGVFENTTVIEFRFWKILCCTKLQKISKILLKLFPYLIDGQYQRTLNYFEPSCNKSISPKYTMTFWLNV